MKNSPCFNCPYRKPTCHDFCAEYLDWHAEVVAFDKARKFDKLMVTEYEIGDRIIADQIIWKNSTDRRNKK